MRVRGILAVAGVGLMFAGPAMAHPGHGADGVAAGLLHPLTGLDHLAAMVAVGWAAVAGGGRLRLFALPSAFVAAMALGAVLAWTGHAPAAWGEVGILASLIALAGLLAVGSRAALAPALILTALCAVSHGFAHAAEAPHGGLPVSYFAGFLVTTAALHAAGAAAGFALARLLQQRERLLRYLAGAALVAIAAAGLAT